MINWRLTRRREPLRARSFVVWPVLISLMPLAACSTQAAPPMVELQAQAEDVTLHARIAGDPEAVTVLIAVHGGPGNASD